MSARDSAPRIASGSDHAARVAGGSDQDHAAPVAGGPHDAAPVAGGPHDAAPVAGGPHDAAPVAGGPHDAARVTGGSDQDHAARVASGPAQDHEPRVSGGPDQDGSSTGPTGTDLLCAASPGSSTADPLGAASIPPAGTDLLGVASHGSTSAGPPGAGAGSTGTSPACAELLGVASPGWTGADLLESGPERPPGESGLHRLRRDVRRWWRGAGSGPWRRRAVAATAAVAAAGAIVALRAGTPSVPPEEAVAADPRPGPVIIYGRARMQPPPFDRLPGRTPIPAPSPVGRPAETVRGDLPATGPLLGEEAARDAVRLVLGRYCRWPRAYQIALKSHRGWREVTATVLSRAYGEPRRLTSVRLRWTGEAYAWEGWPAQLARCA